MSTVATVAKMPTIRWQSTASAKRSAASARPLPVRMPRASTPRYNIARQRAMLNENSPAIVEATLPP
jgi:hypothetical protein